MSMSKVVTSPATTDPVPSVTLPISADVYGIKNCTTVRAAITWLTKSNVQVTLHDYKQTPPSHSLLDEFASSVGWEQVLNKSSLTFRRMPLESKENLAEATAINLMHKNPTLIKRPIVRLYESHRSFLLLGFNPQEYSDHVSNLAASTPASARPHETHPTCDDDPPLTKRKRGRPSKATKTNAPLQLPHRNPSQSPGADVVVETTPTDEVDEFATARSYESSRSASPPPNVSSVRGVRTSEAIRSKQEKQKPKERGRDTSERKDGRTKVVKQSGGDRSGCAPSNVAAAKRRRK